MGTFHPGCHMWSAVVFGLVSQAIQTSIPTAVATIPLSFPRDSQNYVSKEDYQVKNTFIPFPFLFPYQRGWFYLALLVVLLAWSNPSLLSNCPFLYRLAWLVFNSRGIIGMGMKENWDLWEGLRNPEGCVLLLSPRVMGKMNALLAGLLQQVPLLFSLRQNVKIL